MILPPPVTVTLNAAIDVSLAVKDLAVGELNRVQNSKSIPAGKGINVSRSLAILGIPSIATGFLPEDDERSFIYHLGDQIANSFIRIPGKARRCYKVISETKLQVTELNESGALVEDTHFQQLEQQIDELAHHERWFILSGSLPVGVPSDYYEKLIRKIKEAGSHVLLDTSGEALKKGVQASPDLIKPNQVEYADLIGSEKVERADLQHSCRQLVDSGITEVIVSLGKDGAFYCTQKESYFAKPPECQVVNTVGAGDSMVAGLIAGKMIDLKANLLSYSIACSISCLQHDEPIVRNLSDVTQYQQEVIICDSLEKL